MMAGGASLITILLPPLWRGLFNSREYWCQTQFLSKSREGYLRLEDLANANTGSAQGFVAMWFNDSMETAYEQGFHAGIEAADYDPLRVDSVEHIGKIDDEIMAQIRRSRFVVA